MEKNPRNNLIMQGERLDDLQNGYYVIQNPDKFCFGMDAVLLSGFARIRKNEKVLDMGTGTDQPVSGWGNGRGGDRHGGGRRQNLRSGFSGQRV